MRLGLVLLATGATTAGLGYGGFVGEAADFFRLVACGCLVMGLCLLVGRRRRKAS